MPAISLRLPARLLELSGDCAAVLRLSRAEYIRRALEPMNQDTRARLRADRLQAVSDRVRQGNMCVNADFDAIERDVNA